MTSARPRLPRAMLAVGLSATLLLSMLATVNASSHREAPLIAEDPVADNTDVYAFVSPDAPDTVTLISNWIPLQVPAGGPNFYNFGEDVLYQVHIDNDGDAVADITYEWRFRTEIANPDTFLYATGPIESLDDPDFNLRQTYTLAEISDGVRTVLGQNLPVPPNNVGPRSTPDYEALADAAIVELEGGYKSFAGQRDEAFQVDLGSIFDLGGLRPLNEAHIVPLPAEDGVDATAGLNVHSVVLQVPTAELTRGGSGYDPVIGVWSTTDRRRSRVFAGGNGAMPVHNGPFVQISRLGMPLVNEVVIPLGIKDTFNAIRPDQDAAALSQPDGSIPLLQDPELGRLIELLYSPTGIDVPDAGRTDLITIYLTGIPDLNQPRDLSQPGEMIRLNTSIMPTESDPNEQNRLGLLGGDLDGFPNGRRLIDDTVDISLQVVAGNTPLTPEFQREPNSLLGDGVDFNDKPLLTSFPYIPHPHSGYDYTPPVSSDS